MKSKKGQAQVWIILAILLIGGLGFGWFSSNKNCDAKLLKEKEMSNQLGNQLSQMKADLNNANILVENKDKQLNDLGKALNSCKSPEPEKIYEKFSFFWLGDIKINKFWNVVINLSFGISLISIPLFKFVIFGKKKKNET